MKPNELHNLSQISNEINRTINVGESAHLAHETVLEVAIPREIKYAVNTILSGRVEQAKHDLADYVTAVPIDDVEARINMLREKPTAVENKDDVLKRWHDILTDIVPEAEKSLIELEEEERAQALEEANTLSPAEGSELQALESITKILDRPVRIPGMFEALYPSLEYTDTYPRPHIDINGTGHESSPGRTFIGMDRALRQRIVEFLREQPLMKTIVLEDMYHLIPDKIFEDSLKHQTLHNEQHARVTRQDALIRSRIRDHLNPSRLSGAQVFAEMSRAGLYIQRGGRSLSGQRGGIPLVICRILSAEQANDPTLCETTTVGTVTDRWELTQPMTLGLGGKEVTDRRIEGDAPIEPEQPQYSQEIEPKTIAKEALQKTLITPLIRRKVVNYFVTHENQITSIGNLYDAIRSDEDISKLNSTFDGRIRDLMAKILNPSQKSMLPTIEALISSGIVVERGVLTITGSDGRKQDSRVFRMQLARSEARLYPYVEKTEDTNVVWESILAEYKDSKVESQTNLESTNTSETPAPVEQSASPSNEVRIDPAVIVQVKIFNIVKWLADKNILAATQSSKSIVKIRPEKILANGEGEVQTKKLLRILKNIELIEDDKNITVRDLVLAGLLPSYQNELSKAGKASRLIMGIVDRTLSDYYDERRSQKASQASSGLKPKRRR